MKKIEIPGGFLIALTIIFLSLQLTGHINWHWFWLVSPMLLVFLPLVLVLLVGLAALLVAGILLPILDWIDRRRR